MSLAKLHVRKISGGKVLDVATGTGNFVHYLKENLKDFTEIIGLDFTKKAQNPFEQAFANSTNIHFRLGNGEKLDFPDENFDLVTVSNSLHHFSNPTSVLKEMNRVLKPGGKIIIAEMFSDNQTPIQMVHVDMHHWWAKIDRLREIVHNETFTYLQLRNLTDELNLRRNEFFVELGKEQDLDQEKIVKDFDQAFTRYFEYCTAYPHLIKEGQEIQNRMHQIGFQLADSMMYIGTKES